MTRSSFWARRRVFLTGHTGFKGGWLALWLQQLGAQVRGYSLEPPTNPNLFTIARVGDAIDDIRADVRDAVRLWNEIKSFCPEVVIHMAAQSLVGASYENPIETYETNVMGTVNLFEAVRKASCVRAVINVTSDKCYHNRESAQGYRETDALGGYDPYSSSKGCAELVTTAYLSSFFNPAKRDYLGVALASVRAGNVIGGGDWAKDRLLPDIMRAVFAGRAASIRNPGAVRPWQHILEPLRGYLMLAERLWDDPKKFTGPWNFGPCNDDIQPVRKVVAILKENLGKSLQTEDQFDPNAWHEANLLKLDISKAQRLLGWTPYLRLNDAIAKTVQWYQAAQDGKDMRAATLAQITRYAAVVSTNALTG